MTTRSSARMIVAALWELFRHDIRYGLGGFRAVQKRFLRNAATGCPLDPDLEIGVCRAMDSAVALYPKRVLCLQRALATALLFRKRGIHARVVVGYRPMPFFSHAWVEASGQVIGDAPNYRQRLKILFQV